MLVFVVKKNWVRLKYHSAMRSFRLYVAKSKLSSQLPDEMTDHYIKILHWKYLVVEAKFVGCFTLSFA